MSNGTYHARCFINIQNLRIWIWNDNQSSQQICHLQTDGFWDTFSLYVTISVTEALNKNLFSIQQDAQRSYEYRDQQVQEKKEFLIIHEREIKRKEIQTTSQQNMPQNSNES